MSPRPQASHRVLPRAPVAVLAGARRAFVLAGIFALALVAAYPARAHWADLSVVQVIAKATGTEVTLTVPCGFFPQSDLNHDGRVLPDEVAHDLANVSKVLEPKIVLLGGGGAPVRFRVTAALRPQGLRVDPRIATDLPGDTHVTLKLAFEPAPTAGLRLRYDLFVADAPNATCMATILLGEQMSSHLFTQQDRECLVGEPAAAGMTGHGARAAATRPWALLFLFALLMLPASTAQLLEVFCAYVLAHAAGLVLAALEVIGVAGTVLEVALVGAIPFAAIETRLREDLSGRWKLAAGFGLLHGVALAGVLRAAVPRDEVTAALPGFAIGAELAQAAAVLGLVLLTRAIVPAKQGGARTAIVSALLVGSLALYASGVSPTGP